MGIRFRKSVSLGKGVRLNFSKKGVGISAGVKGLRIGTGPSGSRVRASLPGTGLFIEKRLGSSKRSKSKMTKAQQRQIELEEKAQKLQDEKELAQVEVEAFENYIDHISSIHKIDVEKIDWEEIATSQPPFDEMGPNEREAIDNLKNYKPTFRDWLFRRKDARIRILKEKVEEAKKKDKKLLEKWKEEKQFAQQILTGDTKAMQLAIEKKEFFNDLNELGSEVKCQVNDNNSATVIFVVNSDKVIPNEEKTLTKTGKLSIKKMAKSKYYELQKNYVCGGILQIAKIMFNMLPIEQISLNATDSRLDEGTGQIESGTIVTVNITRDDINQINFDAVDVQKAIENMDHMMKFRKTKGFAFID